MRRSLKSVSCTWPRARTGWVADWFGSLSFAWRYTALFAVITLFILVVAGYLLSRHVVGEVTRQAETGLERSAQSLASSVSSQLSPNDLGGPITGESQRQLNLLFTHAAASGQTLRVKLWNMEGLIVYSDNPEIVGNVYPVGHELAEALSGRIATELSALQGPDNVGEREHKRLLEVYVPLRFPGASEVPGALAVYQDYSNVEALGAATRRAVQIGVGMMIMAVYVSTIWLVKRGSDTMRRREGELIGEIAAREQAQGALQASEAKFRTMTETVAAAAFIFQGEAIRYVNAAAEVVTGYTREELLAMEFWTVIHPDSQELVRDRGLARQRGEQVPSRYEVKIVTKRGELRWVDFMAAMIEFEGAPAVLGTAFDISDRKRAEEEIKHLAFHDGLTGLPNRALLEDRIAVALAQGRRLGQPLGVIFLDLDQFKLVNDTMGHAMGDQLLRSVARRLEDLVREGDTVARIGGDEFTVVLSTISGAEDASDVASRILEAFRQPWVLAGREFVVTASMGIAVYPGDGEDADDLLRSADTAMYRAKDHGGDNFQVFSPAMSEYLSSRVAVESDLRRALEREEFVLHYQPLVNVATGEIVGLEALVRWQHPARGLIYPDGFIPVAEDTGLIVPLGAWVLHTACAQNKALQEAGLPPVRVAVNLSAREFQRPDLVAAVGAVLETTRLDAQWLELEITESTAMKDVDLTAATLTRLRELGVQVSIDDFGTGYSSLAYLKRFSVDCVKIDRSFVHDIVTDSDDAAIVAATVGLARSLRLRTVAEGVETEEQLAFLRQQNCSEAQGYLFSRPVSAEHLPAILVQKGSPETAAPRPLEAATGPLGDGTGRSPSGS